MRKPKPIIADPTESDIQHAAYLLWIEEGRPDGRDFEHWLAAKEILRHGQARAQGRNPRPRPNFTFSFAAASTTQ